MKLEKREQLWNKVNKMEEEIDKLSKKGLNFSSEMRKRRELLNKIKELEHGN